MSAPPPPPPPPPLPGKDWKPNWREQRAKEEAAESSKSNCAGSAPNNAAPLSPGGETPRQHGEVGQYDKLPGALLKTAMGPEKKPFTYTPAGLDLSEIKSPNIQRRINRARENLTGERASSPIFGTPPSTFLDDFGTSGSASEYTRQMSNPSRGPPPVPPRSQSKMPMSPGVRPDTARYGGYFDDLPDISEYCNDPSRLDDSMVNPRYRGSNNPSRSFKVLEKLTAGEIEEEPEPPRQFKSRIQPPRAYASNKESPRNYPLPPVEPMRNKPATPPIQQPYVFPGVKRQPQQQQPMMAAQHQDQGKTQNNWYQGPISPQGYPQSAPVFPSYNSQAQPYSQGNYGAPAYGTQGYGLKSGPLSPRLYTPPVKPEMSGPPKAMVDPFEDFWPSFNALAQPAYDAYATLKSTAPRKTNQVSVAQPIPTGYTSYSSYSTTTTTNRIYGDGLHGTDF